MKFLHIIIGLNIGGAENALKRLIESHIGNDSYKHIVISLTSIGEIGKQLQKQGITVYTLGLKSVVNFPLIFYKLIKLIKLIKPDIVHTWMYHADLVGGIAGKLTGKRVIWSIRNTLTAVGTGTAPATYYIMRICAYLSGHLPVKIVCVAHAAITTHTHYGYNHQKMLVIPNGYDFNLLMQKANEVPRVQFRHSYGIDSKQIVIGSVGRFNDCKDYPNFIRAASIIIEKYDNVIFLLVGRNIDKSNIFLMQLINKTKRPDCFILLGERSDVPACLNAMDIFCLHSVSEGFPNVLAEAMSIGLPCITTDVGDAALIINMPDLVCPPSDSIALASRISQLIEKTPDERRAIGERLQKNIRSNYSLEAMRTAYEKLYHEVINGSF